MKKYYDLPNKKIVAMLDWKKGGTLEQAKKYLTDPDVKEITLSEFNKLGKQYCEGKTNE